MNQRGLCQTVEVMEEAQKLQPVESKKLINIEIQNPEQALNKAVIAVAYSNNNHNLQYKFERMATEE